jgi:hypothetical protein
MKNLTKIFKDGLKIDHENRLKKLNLKRETLSDFLIGKKKELLKELLHSIELYKNKEHELKILSESFLRNQRYKEILEKRPEYVDYKTETLSLELINSEIVIFENKNNSNNLLNFKNIISKKLSELDFIFRIDHIVINISEIVFFEKECSLIDVKKISFNEAEDIILSLKYLEELKCK